MTDNPQTFLLALETCHNLPQNRCCRYSVTRLPQVRDRFLAMLQLRFLFLRGMSYLRKKALSFVLAVGNGFRRLRLISRTATKKRAVELNLLSVQYDTCSHLRVTDEKVSDLGRCIS